MSAVGCSLVKLSYQYVLIVVVPTVLEKSVYLTVAFVTLMASTHTDCSILWWFYGGAGRGWSFFCPTP